MTFQVAQPERVQTLVVGAGLAAYGALAGLVPALPAGARTAVLTGGWLAGRTHLPLAVQDTADAGALQRFGMPRVRRLGAGGTSHLWHGGLFVPHPSQSLVRSAANAYTYACMREDLGQLLAGHQRLLPAVARHLRTVERSANAARDDPPWRRRLLVPRLRWSLAQRDLQQLGPGVSVDERCVLRLERHGGGWRALACGPAGFSLLQANTVIVAAGALGTAALLRASLELLQDMPYSDHLHVFAGVLSRSQLPPATAALLQARGCGDDLVEHGVLAVEAHDDEGRAVEVSFTLRAVANPDFPRLGRRFGQLVGANALGVAGKLALAARHPLTTLEMLAYKFGISLPFDALLVHATVCPHAPVGAVGAHDLAFDPPVRALTGAVERAMQALVPLLGVPDAALRRFPREQVAQSMVSGAQFHASLGAAAQALRGNAGAGLWVADTAIFEHTGTQNQGLLSMCHGYRQGAAAARLLR